MNPWNEPPATSLAAVMAVCDRLFALTDEDELCRCAVECLRSEIGLDRAGILLADPATRSLRGTYGIDEQGRLREEKNLRFFWNELETGRNAGVQPFYLDLKRETEASGLPSYRHILGSLGNDKGEIVGSGELVVSAIWDGFRVIGSMSCDNLLRGRPIQPSQVEAARLIALILGQLLHRSRAEQSLADSEALFRSVWDNSIDAMRLTDETGRILAVNQGFCRLFQTSEAHAVGKKVNELFHQEHDQSLQEYLSRFAPEAASRPIRLRRRLAGGPSIEIEATYSKFALSNGTTRLLSVIRDATDAVRQEAERLEMEKRLLQSQRMESLGLMAGGVAHDFNNMLTGILGNTSLALMNLPAGSPIRDDLQRVEQICFQAAELCQQLLAYSGRGRFEVRAVRLNDLIGEMHHLLQVSIHKKIRLQLDLDPGLPSADLDVPQIRQLILNLVINASEAIGDCEGTIRIGTARFTADADALAGFQAAESAGPGAFIRLEVTDTGAGIQPDDLQHIFDPFFSTKFTGRGLGLAAVQGIVRGHGGALRVESKPGQGATFTFLFPQGTESAPAAPAAQTAPEATAPGQAARILVVDDEPTIRNLASRILALRNHQITLAHEGSEALDLFRTDPEAFDCVLLDLTMPRMSGHEVMEAMRALNPHTPILIMSGYSEADIARKFHGISPTGFIQKPFNAAELTRQVELCLGARDPLRPGQSAPASGPGAATPDRAP
jgi:PAS domain S-box-containing protein